MLDVLLPALMKVLALSLPGNNFVCRGVEGEKDYLLEIAFNIFISPITRQPRGEGWRPLWRIECEGGADVEC